MGRQPQDPEHCSGVVSLLPTAVSTFMDYSWDSDGHPEPGQSPSSKWTHLGWQESCTVLYWPWPWRLQQFPIPYSCHVGRCKGAGVAFNTPQWKYRWYPFLPMLCYWSATTTTMLHGKIFYCTNVPWSQGLLCYMLYFTGILISFRYYKNSLVYTLWQT